MATINIYYARRKIDSRKFMHNFYIVKEINKPRLFWETGEEQAESERGGVIHIWIQAASTDPRISFVRPDWQITVNDDSFGPGLHEDIDVNGKTVKLRYEDYLFVCHFPATDVSQGSSRERTERG